MPPCVVYPLRVLRLLFGRLAGALALLFAGGTFAPAAAPLVIDRTALHQYDDGPLLAANHEFLPGETVFFSCRLKNYQLEKKKEDEYQGVKLGWRLSVSDPAGVLLEKEATGRIEERVLPEDKSWLPKFVHTFLVPPFAPGGVYHISVKVRDEIGGTEAGATLDVRVKGSDVKPSDTLVVRNFRFLRNEDDPVPLQPAAYHPGETLWARFEIVGYKFSEGNRFSVDYGLAVLRGAPEQSGQQLFSQPVAASHASESFYPQRYVPGALSLNLDKSVAPGAYTLLVTVRDQIGNQLVEVRQGFRVE